MLMLATATPATAADESDPAVQRMIDLFGEVCLSAFPDDAAVDAIMAQVAERQLTPDQVRVTFNDDPGRGWLVADGDAQIQVMLELPPYHACSVRRGTNSGLDNPAAYRALIDDFSATHPGFVAQEPIVSHQGGLEIRGDVLVRELPGGRRESLMVIEQRVLDEDRRAAGETGVSLRFVYQVVGSTGGKS